MKFSINDFFSKRDHFRRKLQVWSHLLKNYLMDFSFVMPDVMLGRLLLTPLHRKNSTTQVWKY